MLIYSLSRIFSTFNTHAILSSGIIGNIFCIFLPLVFLAPSGMSYTFFQYKNPFIVNTNKNLWVDDIDIYLT